MNGRIIIQTSTDKIPLDDERKETIVKGLRLLLLVGNERECSTAASLLAVLLPRDYQ